jgi:hypothetical protein
MERLSSVGKHDEYVVEKNITYVVSYMVTGAGKAVKKITRHGYAVQVLLNTCASGGVGYRTWRPRGVVNANPTSAVVISFTFEHVCLVVKRLVLINTKPSTLYCHILKITGRFQITGRRIHLL